MIVNIYTKGGQKIVLPDITGLTTRRHNIDDVFTSFEVVHKNPDRKIERFHSGCLSEIAFITTEDR